METIHVMGAGPAGLTAALVLARAGRRVVVYERASGVGSRHDGDYEGIENWTTEADVWTQFSGWGISKNFQAVPICRAQWFGPGFSDTALVEDPQPLFYLTPRGSMANSLDHGLLRQALDAGVQVEFNRAVNAEEVDIIAAGFPRARAFAVGYNFETSAANGVYACLDDNLTPGLYSYVLLCEGRGTIAACAMSPEAGMKERLPRIVEGFRSRVDFDMRESRYFAASVGFGFPRTAQKNGKLYVGEAAGFQDSLAGFGIRMCMTTGYLAAQSIIEGRDYDAMWRARYGELLKVGAVNRFFQELLGNRGYPLLLRYMRRFTGRGRVMMHRQYNPLWYKSLAWHVAKRVEGDRLFQSPD